MNQLKAIITVGCSASGKSTFAKKYITKDNWVEINRDNIRFLNKEKNWNNYKFTKKNEKDVSKKWDSELDTAISLNKNIIVSDTNINNYYRKKLIEKLELYNYDITIKFFDVEFEELLKRDRQRKAGVGYEVLLNQYIKYKRENIKQYQPLKNKEKIYIVDIDGTLAKASHRNIYDINKVITDEPIEHVVNIIKSLINSNYKIIFLSGREDSCRQQTCKWLQNNIYETITNDDLFMRTTGDFRKDYIIKMELFDLYIRNNYNVLAAIDDRKQVIECCWNVLNINVINVGNSTERF
jgi:predicted kinase